MSSILQNERKQFDLKCHRSKVEFFCSFFGRYQTTFDRSKGLLIEQVFTSNAASGGEAIVPLLYTLATPALLTSFCTSTKKSFANFPSDFLATFFFFSRALLIHNFCCLIICPHFCSKVLQSLQSTDVC